MGGEDVLRGTYRGSAVDKASHHADNEQASKGVMGLPAALLLKCHRTAVPVLPKICDPANPTGQPSAQLRLDS